MRRSRHRFGDGIAAIGVSIGNHWGSASANLSGPGLSISQCISPSAGPLAHREEQGTFNPKVPGSRPGRPTKNPSAEGPWNHWGLSVPLVARLARASPPLSVDRHSCSLSVGRAWADRFPPWRSLLAKGGPWAEPTQRTRDETPNHQVFDNLLEARVLLEDHRIDYNVNRAHSAHGWMSPTAFAAHLLSRHQQSLASSVDQRWRIVIRRTCWHPRMSRAPAVRAVELVARASNAFPRVDGMGTDAFPRCRPVASITPGHRRCPTHGSGVPDGTLWCCASSPS